MSEETFVCVACGHRLPLAVRHEEAPEYCVLDYISEADQEFIEQVVAEVLSPEFQGGLNWR